jgi:two-component system, chemotaxis family, sensor kinase CheA
MFTLDEDIVRQLRATFKIEAAEHIQAMNRVLLTLEENPEGEQRTSLIEEIFREAHSLKGAAGAADFSEVESTAHKLESAFGAAKSGKISLTRDVCDILYAGIDAVAIIVDSAFDEKPHGIDLPALHARLIQVAEGRGGAGEKKADAPAAAAAKPAGNGNSPPVAGNGNAASVPAAGNGNTSPAVAETSVPPAAAAPSGNGNAVPPQTDSRNTPAPQPPAPAPESPAPRKTEERKKGTGSAQVVEETIRVATSKIDSLMTQSGELLVAGLKIDQRLNELNEMNRLIEEWNREWLKARAASNALLRGNGSEQTRPLIKLLDMDQEKLRVLSSKIIELKRSFVRDALHLSRVINNLGEGVMKVRMLPVSTVFDLFPRLVRDVSRECGKEVELKLEGADTELDRKVLEEIKDPLMHLLRNAVDHGVERPDERERAGKPRGGSVIVRASQKANNIVLEVCDDGGGIDRDRVKKQAIKAGLITAAEADTMSDDETLRLIFAPGLSTSASITQISGRGVGMDVVRRNVEALQGQVEIESVLGKGTTTTLTLPLTLATTQVLLVGVGDQIYGIPISAVERIIRIQSSDVSMVTGHQAIIVNGEPVSLTRLSEVLERPAGEASAKLAENVRLPVVILHFGKTRMAFLVESVVGQQETVVKSLGKQLARVRNVAGATILGSGRVMMTLNPVDLAKSARQSRGKQVVTPKAKPAASQEPKRKTVLVADDSLSTRTLEKSILETAGYKVMVAADGMEALSVLNSNGSCDLIVSDVLMPRMTGFDLTAAVRQDPKLKKIPVILVTSLDSREDKEKGIQVGADAYIIKSNFDQSNLLQTIAQLI